MTPRFLFSLLFAFCGLNAGLLNAQTKGDPPYLNKAPLTAELKYLGDFSLSDSKGTVFLVGRMVVDFTSIYTVIVDHPEAKGECPFMVAEIKDGIQGKMNLHNMRYFIRDGKSVLYLYSNVPKSEIAVEFEFTPGKEFAEGSIRVHETNETKLVGSFKMRIKDVEKTP